MIRGRQYADDLGVPERGWLDTLVTSSTAGTIQNLDYSRDALGRITGVGMVGGLSRHIPRVGLPEIGPEKPMAAAGSLLLSTNPP